MIEIEELYKRWNDASESKRFISLLPLLEYGYAKGAALLQDNTPLDQSTMEALIEYALSWPVGGGWSLLAIEWLENGFPMNESIADLLLFNSKDKTRYSQDERHRAQKLLSMFSNSG